MRFAICDDDRSCLMEYGGLLQSILNKHNLAVSIECYDNYKALMFELEGEEGIDVLFLDINMPDVNGIEVASQIRQRQLDCEIIFLTVSRSHMLSAFDYGAFHYIIKGDTSKDKLEEICLKVAERVTRRKQESITVSCAGETHVIPLEEIKYFEVCNSVIIVHYNDTYFEFYSTMGKIENNLLGRGFVRSHRSYLVNLSHVRTMIRQTLELSGGIEIPVGRKYADDVRALVQKQGELSVEKLDKIRANRVPEPLHGSGAAV